MIEIQMNLNNFPAEEHFKETIVGIVGAPQCGKTLFALALALRIAKQLGYNIFFYDLGMELNMELLQHFCKFKNIFYIDYKYISRKNISKYFYQNNNTALNSAVIIIDPLPMLQEMLKLEDIIKYLYALSRNSNCVIYTNHLLQSGYGWYENYLFNYTQFWFNIYSIIQTENLFISRINTKKCLNYALDNITGTFQIKF